MVNDVILLAVLAGAFFSTANIIMRIGVIEGDPTNGTAISVFIGTVVVFIASVIEGSLLDLVKIDIISYLYLGIGGLINFILGRALFYHSAKIIGIARAQLINATSPIFIIAIGIIILGESLSNNEAISITFMILGMIVISVSNIRFNKSQDNKFIIGISFALAAALLRAIAPFFIAQGLAGTFSPIAATFISYAISSIGWIAVLIPKRRILKIKNNLALLKIFVVQGTVVSLAIISIYIAIDIGRVIIILPIVNTISPVFTVAITYLFLQRIERVSIKVWLALILVVIGIYLNVN